MLGSHSHFAARLSHVLRKSLKLSDVVFVVDHRGGITKTGSFNEDGLKGFASCPKPFLECRILVERTLVWTKHGHRTGSLAGHAADLEISATLHTSHRARRAKTRTQKVASKHDGSLVVPYCV